jgi:hypothetical protein
MANYVLEGPKFGSSTLGTAGGTVTWAVDATVPAAFVATLTQAFADWSTYANIQFTQVASVGNAAIDLGFAAIDGLSNVLGDATYSYRGSQMLSAAIRFDSDEGWHPSPNGIVSQGNASLFTVAVHEIGHAIGLGHYDATPSIMNTYLDRTVADLQASDIEGIRALYGAASRTFDGSAALTVSRTDPVSLTMSPGTFVSATEAGGAVTLTFAGAQTLTVTGATLGTSGLPNVGLADGDFLVGGDGQSLTGTKANALILGGAGASRITDVVDPAQTPGTHIIFGGLGFADPDDGGDTVIFGGKGSWGIFGNAGADSLQQGSAAFDSRSYVSVFGGRDDDAIRLTDARNLDAKMAIYGGEGTDTIRVFNTGADAATAIFGGQGAADPTDGADTIQFAGGGRITIYGNGGNDSITLGTGTDLDATTVAAVYGGAGRDTLTVEAGQTRTVASVFGGEDGDAIRVHNTGTTVIYGDTAASDPAGGNDSIAFVGSGTVTIYATGGDDSVSVTVEGGPASTIAVYGGAGNDSLTLAAATPGGLAQASVTLATGTGADTVTVRMDTATPTPVTITDFTLGQDRLVFTGTGTNGPLALATGTSTTLQAALDLAASAASANGTRPNGTGVVVFAGDAYVVHNAAADTSYTVSTDGVIRLVGASDLSVLARLISVEF